MISPRVLPCRRNACPFYVESFHNCERNIWPYEVKLFDRMPPRVVMKRTSRSMKPSNQLHEFLATLHPPASRVDEHRIIQTLIWREHIGGPVIVPTRFESKRSQVANRAFILL
jgi:hypothetical protein